MSESRICPVCENEIPSDWSYICPHCNFELKWLDDEGEIERAKKYLDAEKLIEGSPEVVMAARDHLKVIETTGNMQAEWQIGATFVPARTWRTRTPGTRESLCATMRSLQPGLRYSIPTTKETWHEGLGTVEPKVALERSEQR